MKSNLKVFRLIALLAVFSLVLAACGGGAATEVPVSNEMPATEAPQATEMVPGTVIARLR